MAESKIIPSFTRAQMDFLEGKDDSSVFFGSSSNNVESDVSKQGSEMKITSPFKLANSYFNDKIGTIYQHLSANMNGLGREFDDDAFLSFSDDSGQPSTFPMSDERYQYAVTISYTDAVVDESTKKISRRNVYICLDQVASMGTSLDSEITQYPTTDRDYIMDHMFNRPVSVTIRGKFSLYGRNARIEGSASSPRSSRLVDIQNAFESIKERGYIVSLTTFGPGGMIFKRRPSMVLRNITWDANDPSSLGFTFTFNEIRLALLRSQNLIVDETDENLPSTLSPAKQNLTDTVIDWSQWLIVLLNRGIEENFIYSDFFNAWAEKMMKEYGVNDSDNVWGVGGKASSVIAGLTVTYVASQGASLVIGLLAGAGYAAVAGGPAGWIALAAVAVGAAIAAACVAIWNAITGKNKYKVKQFKAKPSDDNFDSECVRFNQFLDSAQDAIDALSSTTTVYSFSSTGNCRATFLLDGNYYIFEFTENNTGDSVPWHLTIRCVSSGTDTEGTVIYDGGLVWYESYPVNGILDSNGEGNCLTIAESVMASANFYAYFIKNRNALDAAYAEYKQTSEYFSTKYSQDEYDEYIGKKDLRNYYFVFSSTYYPEAFFELLRQTLESTFLK